ncbi:MAG: hypothetical protein ACYC5H_08290 [Methylovirgula sp.]
MTIRKRADGHLPSEFFHIFANSPVDPSLYRQITKIVPSEKPDCVVVTLITLGGSAHDAYRTGRFLQMAFKEIYIHVPTVCASAGTLLVCAGNGLIIGAMSELGPLDAQILKSDELGERRSGLVVRSLFENLGTHAFELHTSLVEKIIDHSGGAIKYRTAAHVAGEMVVGLMRGLYEQMNPEQIGEDYRFLKIAEEYGRRLAEKSEIIKDQALRTLVYDFPSHDFIIDFREAVRLFARVNVPSSILLEAIGNETATPLNPLSSRDRIIRGWVISGCPIYETESETGTSADDAAPESTNGSSGSPPPTGNGANPRKPRPRRPNADRGVRQGGEPGG